MCSSDLLLIFTQDTVQMLQGDDPSNFSRSMINTQLGAHFYGSVQVVQNQVFFFSKQGLSQLGLSLLKASLIFSAIGIYLWAVIDSVSAFSGMSLTHAILYALRLIGGGFVALSVVLGYLVNPWFFAFTAFVGLNLFQSAFTNWCPMMSILKAA